MLLAMPFTALGRSPLPQATQVSAASLTEHDKQHTHACAHSQISTETGRYKKALKMETLVWSFS